MRSGQVVKNKLTGKKMIVLLDGVILPNFPSPMVRCRFQVEGGAFSVDHFMKDELEEYAEDIKARAKSALELPPDMRPGGGE